MAYYLTLCRKRLLAFLGAHTHLVLSDLVSASGFSFSDCSVSTPSLPNLLFYRCFP